MHRLDLSQYERCEFLGKGTFGRVELYRSSALASSTSADAAVAVKTFVQSDTLSFSVECAVRELAVCATLCGDDARHSALFAPEGYAPLHGMPCLIMRPSVALSGRMPMLRGKHPDFVCLCRELGSGLTHLHALGFVHRDVKPDNVLCDEQGRCRVADFGCAARHLPGRANTLEVQTLDWRAPEVLMGDASYDHAIDVWSAGLIAYEAVTGDATWKTVDDRSDELLERIMALRGVPPLREWPERVGREPGRCDLRQWVGPHHPRAPRCERALIAALHSKQQRDDASWLLDAMLDWNPTRRHFPECLFRPADRAGAGAGASSAVASTDESDGETRLVLDLCESTDVRVRGVRALRVRAGHARVSDALEPATREATLAPFLFLQRYRRVDRRLFQSTADLFDRFVAARPDASAQGALRRAAQSAWCVAAMLYERYPTDAIAMVVDEADTHSRLVWSALELCDTLQYRLYATLPLDCVEDVATLSPLELWTIDHVVATAGGPVDASAAAVGGVWLASAFAAGQVALPTCPFAIGCDDVRARRVSDGAVIHDVVAARPRSRA